MIATPQRTCKTRLNAVAATETLQCLEVHSLSSAWRRLHHPIGWFGARPIPRTRDATGLGRVDSSLMVSTAATTPAAPIGLDPEEQRVIEERRARRLQRLARRELVSIAVLAGGFLVAAASTVAYFPSERSPALPAVAVLILAYAAARIRT